MVLSNLGLNSKYFFFQWLSLPLYCCKCIKQLKKFCKTFTQIFSFQYNINNGDWECKSIDNIRTQSFQYYFYQNKRNILKKFFFLFPNIYSVISFILCTRIQSNVFVPAKMSFSFLIFALHFFISVTQFIECLKYEFLF